MLNRAAEIALRFRHAKRRLESRLRKTSPAVADEVFCCAAQSAIGSGIVPGGKMSEASPDVAGGDRPRSCLRVVRCSGEHREFASFFFDL